MSLRKTNIVKVWQSGRSPRPKSVPLGRFNEYIQDDAWKLDVSISDENEKTQDVKFDTTITYTNDTQIANDYLIVMTDSSEATTGIPVSDKQNIKPQETIGFAPAIGGYYGIMSRVNGQGRDYEMVDDYEIRYVQPPNPTTSPYKGGIPGWTISEYPPYYELRLNLTDDMNSDYEFQKYLFEIMFSYVSADSNGGLRIPVLSGGDTYAEITVPTISNVRTRNTASVLREGGVITYPFPIMIINDTVDYADSGNSLCARDIIRYQHRMMFQGDNYLIPKFPGQAEPGRYLIFAIRRRTVGLGMSSITEMSGPWGIKVGPGGAIAGENYRAQTDPTSDDDSTQGYSQGSSWINTVTSSIFICTSAIKGSAMWVQISPGFEPLLSSVAVIPAGGENPSIDISIEKDTFNEVGSENLSNWVFQPGATGLAIKSVTRTSASQISIEFDGVANVGTGILIGLKSAFDGQRVASLPLSISVESQ